MSVTHQTRDTGHDRDVSPVRRTKRVLPPVLSQADAAMLELQRSVGNGAVAGLVAARQIAIQRDGDDDATYEPAGKNMIPEADRIRDLGRQVSIIGAEDAELTRGKARRYMLFSRSMTGMGSAPNFFGTHSDDAISATMQDMGKESSDAAQHLMDGADELMTYRDRSDFNEKNGIDFLYRRTALQNHLSVGMRPSSWWPFKS